MDYKNLGKNILKYRKARGLKREQLAENIGISLSFLGHIERGDRVASLDTLVKLANALGIGTDVMLVDSLNALSPVTLPTDLNPKHRTMLNDVVRVISEGISDGWTRE